MSSCWRNSRRSHTNHTSWLIRRHSKSNTWGKKNSIQLVHMHTQKHIIVQTFTNTPLTTWTLKLMALPKEDIIRLDNSEECKRPLTEVSDCVYRSHGWISPFTAYGIADALGCLGKRFIVSSVESV
jgi:hypothetical protein